MSASNGQIVQARPSTNDILFFDDEKVDLIKNTIAKGATNQELALFIHTAQRRGLDPLAKQFYFIKYGNQAAAFVTSIDGLRLIADRTGRYAPGRAAEYEADDKGLVSSTAFVKKLVGSEWHEVSETAYWAEYVQSTNGQPRDKWRTMPRVMLSKCAEARALRRAFPEDLSGLYAAEEINDAQEDGAQVAAVSNEPPTGRQKLNAPRPATPALQPTAVEAAPAAPVPAGGYDEHGYVWCKCGLQAKLIKAKNGKQGYKCHNWDPKDKHAGACDFSMKIEDAPTTESAPEPAPTPVAAVATPDDDDQDDDSNPFEEEEDPDDVAEGEVVEPDPEINDNRTKAFFASATEAGLDTSLKSRPLRISALQEWVRQYRPELAADSIQSIKNIPTAVLILVTNDVKQKLLFW